MMHATEYVQEQTPGYIFWAQVYSGDVIEWKLVTITSEDGIRNLRTGDRVRVASILNTTSYWMRSDQGSYIRMITVPENAPQRELPLLFRMMAEVAEARDMQVSDEDFSDEEDGGMDQG